MSTTHDVPDMLANPEKYGFKWNTGTLMKAGMELTKVAPYMVHLDLSRVREVFGDDYILNMANGTSGKVRDQLLRNDIWEDRSLVNRPDEMKAIVLGRALGHTRARSARVTIVEKLVEVPVKVPTWIADDGTEFTDKAECMAYNVDLRLA